MLLNSITAICDGPSMNFTLAIQSDSKRVPLNGSFSSQCQFERHVRIRVEHLATPTMVKQISLATTGVACIRRHTQLVYFAGMALAQSHHRLDGKNASIVATKRLQMLPTWSSISRYLRVSLKRGPGKEQSYIIYRASLRRVRQHPRIVWSQVKGKPKSPPTPDPAQDVIRASSLNPQHQPPLHPPQYQCPA